MKTKHLQQQHWRKSNQWFLLIRKHAQVRRNMLSMFSYYDCTSADNMACKE